MLLGQLLVLLQIRLRMLPFHMADLAALLQPGHLGHLALADAAEVHPIGRHTRLGGSGLLHRRSARTRIARHAAAHLLGAATGLARRNGILLVPLFNVLRHRAIHQRLPTVSRRRGRRRSSLLRLDGGIFRTLTGQRIKVFLRRPVHQRATIFALRPATLLHATNMRLAKLSIGFLHVAVDLGRNPLTGLATALAGLPVSARRAAGAFSLHANLAATLELAPGHRPQPGLGFSVHHLRRRPRGRIHLCLGITGRTKALCLGLPCCPYGLCAGFGHFTLSPRRAGVPAVAFGISRPRQP